MGQGRMSERVSQHLHIMCESDQQLQQMLQLTRSVLMDAVHVYWQLSRQEGEPYEEFEAKCLDPDWAYLHDRATVEGISFLTKTLPLYGKRLDAALCGADLDTTGFYNRRTKRPLFGWLLTKEYLDPKYRTSPNQAAFDFVPEYVKLVRQITYLFYKYELPYSHATETKVLDAFICTDLELPDTSFNYDVTGDPVLNLASNLIANIVHRFDVKEIIPKHGPGAVATGEKPWQKMRFARIYNALESSFPFTEWMVPSLSWIADNYDRLTRLTVERDGTAKVVLVPKDSRGPRLISCEPLEYQWIQQGISKQLVKLIESHPYTRGRINFSDQEVNRRHALWGSMGASWATLDMKDASDRVSLALVRALFSKTHIYEYLVATRSPATRLPDGMRFQLKKYAPMGSALCFPVEALIFWALSAASIHLRSSKTDLNRSLGSVKVYGDDIITQVQSCDLVIETLERYHLKVNHSKCCTAGFFRESCGLDAYRGVDVTPIKIRSVWTSQPDCKTVCAYVDLHNAFSARGQFYTAEHIEFEMLGRVKPALRLPHVSDWNPRSYLCLRSSHVVDDFKGLPERYNPVYQRSEVRTLVSRPVSVSRKLPGWELLFGALIGLEHRDSVCKAESSRTPGSATNVQSYPLRGRVSLKPRWCQK